MAFDPKSPDTILSISVSLLSPERLARVRELAFERGYDILRDDELFVWQTAHGVRSAIYEDHHYMISLRVPSYLTADNRKLLNELVDALLEELARLVPKADAPPNMAVNPAGWPFTALAFSSAGGQASALAQGQGRARPPRGLSAAR